MTLMGAIKQLHELQSAEDVPFYYKPAIAEVINVLLMDTQEVRHGHWIKANDPMSSPFDTMKRCLCSECREWAKVTSYCPNCGARMDEEGEDG